MRLDLTVLSINLAGPVIFSTSLPTGVGLLLAVVVSMLTTRHHVLLHSLENCDDVCEPRGLEAVPEAARDRAEHAEHRSLLSGLLARDGSGFIAERAPYLHALHAASPRIWQLLARAADKEQARSALCDYLGRRERALSACESPLHTLEQATARDCLRALRDILAPANEQASQSSALEAFWKLARSQPISGEEEPSRGFMLELIQLVLGVEGRSGIYDRLASSDVLPLQGQQAAQRRTTALDAMAAEMHERLMRYSSGLEHRLVRRSARNRRRILGQLGGSAQDWRDYRWQLKHVIRSAEDLARFIELSPEELAAVRQAVQHHIPFGVTPYYLSLMARRRAAGDDHALRAQVIPPPDYVAALIAGRACAAASLDFMGERDTSPVPLITRRYPTTAVFKPYNTCGQICVYCQRNWEIRECLDPLAMASEHALAQALAWLRAHPAIGEVLLTGGDPLIMPDHAVRDILERLAAIPHIYRIRIATRTPVVLPQRWNGALPGLLARYHQPGRREIVVMTHFEHPAEITPEALRAVQRIRSHGMSIYNQQVFTIENSRRFETAKLRLLLRSVGIDPYYTFNMQGKEETRRYRVPIARLLQERKEEARLLPGLDRMDEPVFNVPRLGKNNVSLWQDHSLLGIRPDGRRVYSLHPWEKNISLVPAYTYVDVSIFDYLQELAARGEDIREYRTIWYYL